MDIIPTAQQLLDLRKKANQARKLVIQTLVEAGSGHTAGPLGMADIFIAMYFHILRYNPKEPNWPDRDRFVLSNGHICPILYVTMAMAGFFPIEELKTLRKINSRLQGHPHRGTLPGIETTSGPLGLGIGQSCGMALAGRLDKKDWHVYCATSDGEHEEGSTWEAIMFAGKNKLSNMTVIVDYNNIQIDGNVSQVMPLEPFKEKYKAFNWHTIEIDGNDIGAFIKAMAEAKTVTDKPTVIIARTTPGKGVSFMENDYTWHGKPPTKEEGEKALAELDRIGETLEKQTLSE